MAENKVSEAYIVSNQNTFIGKVSLHGLLTQKDDLPVIKSLIDKSNFTSNTMHLCNKAIEIASEFVGETIPVINLETKNTRCSERSGPISSIPCHTK